MKKADDSSSAGDIDRSKIEDAELAVNEVLSKIKVEKTDVL